jgi:hypothetical protein
MHTLLSLLLPMRPGKKLQECLDAPGPLPFHIVRQVRACILLSECLAAALAAPGLCRSWLQEDEEARHQALMQGMHGSALHWA